MNIKSFLHKEFDPQLLESEKKARNQMSPLLYCAYKITSHLPCNCWQCYINRGNKYVPGKNTKFYKGSLRKYLDTMRLISGRKLDSSAFGE